jgi:hypothetical protein
MARDHLDNSGTTRTRHIRGAAPEIDPHPRLVAPQEDPVTHQEQQANVAAAVPSQPDVDDDDRRWIGLALAAVAIHQLHSAVADPGERPFRAAVLGLETAVAVSAALSLSPEARRARGAVWTLLALGPMAGALIGHLLPIARGQPSPAATETAPLNIAGGALLLTLGIRDFRRGSSELQSSYSRLQRS